MSRSYVVMGGGRGVGRAIVERLLSDADENSVVTMELDAAAFSWTENHPAGARVIPVLGDSDPDDPPERLTLKATSSNRSVLPNGNISFADGTDASRTLTVSSLTGSGTSNVTITLSDGDLQSSVEVKVIAGSAAKNTLSGTVNADMIFARKGNDTASGQGANDLMCGGDGNDKLTGGLGADHFGGGSGTDTATDFNAVQGDTKKGIP
jgi:Ca2+-binding RTX toxin-like protein